MVKKMWHSIQFSSVQSLKEWNGVVCRDVDGPRVCHTEWSKLEREKIYIIYECLIVFSHVWFGLLGIFFLRMFVCMHSCSVVKDGEAWHAAVLEVTKSLTGLSDWTTTTTFPLISLPNSFPIDRNLPLLRNFPCASCSYLWYQWALFISLTLITAY